ncbi:MAG: response regulator [Desulfatibacillaceae bacterium]|nr:response regulator [Desulfatibacillaceae bacterium]
MRVLLVDDEVDLASALAERLDMRGIEADWVSAGADAIKRVEEKKYDVAVLDVKMPGISGLDLKARLEQIDPGMKFIFLTGYGSEIDFKELTCRAGETSCLVKPIDIHDLISMMNSLVKKPERG